MNTNSLLLLGGTWGSALLAAAIAWQVHKPPVPPVAKAEPTVRIAPRPAPVSITPATTVQEVVVMDADRIVGHVARPVAPAAPAVTQQKPRDISEMACTNWTELVQGNIGQRVRYCQ